MAAVLAEMKKSGGNRLKKAEADASSPSTAVKYARFCFVVFLCGGREALLLGSDFLCV